MLFRSSPGRPALGSHLAQVGLQQPGDLAPVQAGGGADAADLAMAETIIAAFALPENQGKGAIRVNGKMTELLHLEQARRLVSQARQIAAAAEAG